MNRKARNSSTPEKALGRRKAYWTSQKGMLPVVSATARSIQMGARKGARGPFLLSLRRGRRALIVNVDYTRSFVDAEEATRTRNKNNVERQDIGVACDVSTLNALASTLYACALTSQVAGMSMCMVHSWVSQSVSQ
jgi:hypothetical protein